MKKPTKSCNYRTMPLIYLTSVFFTLLSVNVLADDETYLVHPMCFDGLYFSDENFNYDEPIKCDPALTAMTVERHNQELNDKKSVILSSDYPHDENTGFNGYISYHSFETLLMEDGGKLTFITLTFNGGGTGQFGMLGLIEITKENELYILWKQKVGDRCNDGYPKFVGFKDDGLLFTTAATPFRLLNPTNDTDWRRKSLIDRLVGDDAEKIPTFANWKPYEDIVNAASACSGSRLFSLNLETFNPTLIGVNVDVGRWASMSQDGVQQCTSNWLLQSQFSTNNDTTFIPLSDWENSLKNLRRACVNN